MFRVRHVAEHPDAKLVIRSLSATTLELELHTADGATLAPFGPIHLERQPDRFFKDLFSEIEGLAARHGTSHGAHRELEDLGAELSKRLLPFELGQLLATIRGDDADELRTLWIQSDEPWIPWELLRLPSAAADRGFQGLFLGEAFAVARWLRALPGSVYPTPRRSFPLHRLALVAPHDHRLDGVAGEVAVLEELFGDERSVDQIEPGEDTVRRALEQDCHDGWHFSGHGLSGDEPTRAEILFGNNQCLRSRSLYAGMLESSRPLVFLNACHTGLTGFSLAGIGGWAEGFLSAGAGAFLGAYWAIEDAPAARFAHVFYSAFLGGSPIAAAVRQARCVIRDEFPGDPTWLAYTLYAHPLALQTDDRDTTTHDSGTVIASAPASSEPPIGRRERDSRPVPSTSPEALAVTVPRRSGRHQRAAVVAMVLVLTAVAVLAIVLWPSRRPAVAVLEPVDGFASSGERWQAVAVTQMLADVLALDGKVRVLRTGTVARSRTELGLERAEPLGPGSWRRLYEHFGDALVVHGFLDRMYADDAGRIALRMRLYKLPSGNLEAELTSVGGSEDGLVELAFDIARQLRETLGVGALTEDWKTSGAKLYPTDSEARRLYFTGLGKLWRFDESGALDSLGKAAALEPGQWLVETLLATTAHHLKDLATARDAARNAFDARNGLPRREKLRLEAIFHEIHEDWDAAASVYQSLRTAFPDDSEYGLQLAEAQVHAGDLEASLETLDALRLLPLSELDVGEVDLLDATTRMVLDDLEPARDLVEKAIRRGHEINARYLEARARLCHAEILVETKQYKEAIETLEVAKRLFERTPKITDGVWNVFSMMTIVLYLQGEAEAAKQKFAEYEEDYGRLGDVLGGQQARTNLGLILPDFGEYRRAEEILSESLSWFRDHGLRYEAAVAANGIGYGRQLSGRLEAAKEGYEIADNIFEQLGHRGKVATIRTNLGEIEFLEGNLAEARRLHESARAVNRELEDPVGEAYDTYRLGVVHLAGGIYKDARKAFEAVLTTDSSDQATQAETTLALAELELAVKNFERARKLAEDAEQVFWDLGWTQWAALSMIHQAQTLLVSEPGELATARELGRRARNHAADTQDSRVRVALAALEARLALRDDDRTVLAESLADLDRLLDEIREVPYRFELGLVQAEIEDALGDRESARARLDQLAADAGDMGFQAIEARARARLRGL